MKYVVIDLEMNPVASVYKAERTICKLEVIEIGAVLLDETYQEIGSFVTLVKPYFNSRIEKRYEKLTGIKTSMVESAPYFDDALHMFFPGATVSRVKFRSSSGAIMILPRFQRKSN